jgi:hypothetical protein
MLLFSLYIVVTLEAYCIVETSVDAGKAICMEAVFKVADSRISISCSYTLD